MGKIVCGIFKWFYTILNILECLYMYIPKVYYLVLTVRRDEHTNYRLFTGTWKSIWLQKEMNNNWTVEACVQ